MTHTHRTVLPSRIQGTVLLDSGERLTPPEDWAFLPAGDAAITRNVKAKGETWVVQVRKGKRLISKGIWAKEAHILASQKEIEAKRATPEYSRRREMDLSRRETKHKAYVGEFFTEVVEFLDFHPRYQNEAALLAEKITAHATPVGSGTVARTERIPIARRAEAAVIAWMRHQTTAYDSMSIARIKGRRREVRRKLAAKSVEILKTYRQGQELTENCPLKKALA
ncbi:MAG: DUF2293 domain-containing protein [Proteobacteria bacterium]|nr:DUF2293 domain-containing protein [Pseudomonadota bacterium]MBU1137479.1 DUF2293 domain-containing protein [Pseudomonadota bacterium]MBU1234169.1 DUF2293 domain-containing protein [Pseudomonadota bacterium]MBU1417450.1 DUF2293 domain-containing protein [Pseudomonadota bacterium]MBU1453139.1 DUF2293 domain-containing protein [Pseudomonadota bacterium]